MAEMGKGIAGGALSGAGMGFTVGGPWGAAIGAGVGAVAGGLQASAAKRQRLAAEAADKAINPIDPAQQAMLNRIGLVERSLRAGTDPASAFAKQSQMNALAQTQANMVRGGFGNVNNLLRSQNAANTGFAQIGAAASQQANSLIPLQANIQNMITERVYQRQQQKRADAYARSAQSQQDLNNLLSGGLAIAPQLAMGLGGMGAGQGMPKTGVARRPNTSAVENFDWTQPRFQSPQMPQFQQAPMAGQPMPSTWNVGSGY